MENGEEVIRDNCGLCVAHTLHDVYSFIKSLQHRGREACGIAAIGDRINVMKWKGTVGNVDLEDLHDIFPAEQFHTYLAHVRYATRGREDEIVEDAHPHFIGGRVTRKENHILVRNCDAIAVHNGQADLEGIVNPELAKTVCDTKLLLDYYKKHGSHKLIQDIPGSYLLAIADKNRKEVVVMRDQFGVKPGCLGLKDGKYCVASEDVAFTENGGRFIEDLEPGTLYYLSDDGGFRREKVLTQQPQHCFFEWNYIANVNSTLDELAVRKMRLELGRALAREFHPEDIDVVTYLPRCPEVAARSYAEAIGKRESFMKVFYKLKGERAFQGTTNEDRKTSIRQNLHVHAQMDDILRGKVVAVIDDSAIRGNNSNRAKELLDSCGVKKIYYVNYTPKIGIIGRDSVPRGCMFGVDMPPDDKFLVRTTDGLRNLTSQQINTATGLNMDFLSPRGMFEAFENAGMPRRNLCSYCIGGKHPFK